METSLNKPRIRKQKNQPKGNSWYSAAFNCRLLQLSLIKDVMVCASKNYFTVFRGVCKAFGLTSLHWRGSSHLHKTFHAARYWSRQQFGKQRGTQKCSGDKYGFFLTVSHIKSEHASWLVYPSIRHFHPLPHSTNITLSFSSCSFCSLTLSPHIFPSWDSKNPER